MGLEGTFKDFKAWKPPKTHPLSILLCAAPRGALTIVFF